MCGLHAAAVARGATASAVTGGATGIGKAVASGLAASGGHAIIVDVADEAAQWTVDEIAAAGGKASNLACDMGETAAVGTLATEVEEEFGRIDFLHNNAFAGWKGPDAHLLTADVSGEHWDHIMEYRHEGILPPDAHGSPIMQRQGGGAIVTLHPPLLSVRKRTLAPTA